MNRTLAVKKVKAYAQNPDLIKEPSMGEMADLVVLVLGAVEQIETAIKEGRLDGKTPQADKDYLSLETAQKALNEKVREMLNKTDTTLSQTSQALQERVEQALQNIRDGKDGIVSDSEIQRAAEVALQMLELPDFDALVAESLTKNADATRDGLESIVNEDDKLKIEAVGYLRQELDDLKSRVGANVISGGLTRGGVLKLIAENGGGASTFLDLTDTPSAYTGQAGKAVVVNLAENALEFVAPTGTGTVTSVAVSGSDGIEVDSGSPITAAGTIALGVNASTLRTHINVADGATANSADATLLARANHTGTQTAFTISDFDTEVSNNTDVAANTAARHAAVTVSGTPDYITLVGQDIVRNQIDLATDVTGDLPFSNIAQIATNRILGRSTAGTGDIEALADSSARTIIGLATTDSPQFNAINLGHATDTTIARVSAGVIAVEGVTVPTISSTSTLTNKTLTAPKLTVVNLGNLGATEAIDFNAGDIFYGTFDSNVTITFSNQADGYTKTFHFAYDGTAQRTAVWTDIDRWTPNAASAAPTMPSAAGEVLTVTVQTYNGLAVASATGNYAVYA